MDLVVGAREALMTSAAAVAEAQGLLEIRGDGRAEDSGVRLTASGRVAAIALGFDPFAEDGRALAGLVNEVARKWTGSGALNELAEAEAELRAIEARRDEARARVMQASRATRRRAGQR